MCIYVEVNTNTNLQELGPMFLDVYVHTFHCSEHPCAKIYFILHIIYNNIYYKFP